jgi:hypothetical protein
MLSQVAFEFPFTDKKKSFICPGIEEVAVEACFKKKKQELPKKKLLLRERKKICKNAERAKMHFP